MLTTDNPVRVQRRRGIFTILMTLTVFVVFLASCASSGTSEVSNERGPDDLARCFAFSIDQVGRGNLDAGIERFDPCLSDDYTFEFIFFEGGPSIVCPGAECPIQEFSSRADMRARFAELFFVDAGYLATQHQILNLDVTEDGDNAEVFAYIQANHFLPDNSVDIAWNDYEFDAVRDDGAWVVTSEVITGTAYLNFEATPVG